MFRKWLVASLALALLVTSPAVYAKPPGNPGGPDKGKPAAQAKERIHAKQAIQRTAVVLKAAQKAALKGGVQAGLGLAFGHQQYALKLYKEGLYTRAIHHTLRARALAATVIERNKAPKVLEIVLTADELAYRPLLPKDADLDGELKVKFTTQIPTDAGALKLELVFNLD